MMKKITFLCFALFALAFNLDSTAQCTTGGVYGGTALLNNGAPEEQAPCNYYGEYSDTTNVNDGDDYTFDITGGGYVTVTTSDGLTVIGHGVAPLSLTGVTTSGDGAIRVYWHADAACGTDTNCHATTVQNDSVVPPPSGGSDLCGDADPLVCGDVFAFDTTGADLDDAVTCGTTAFSNNVWFSYTGDGSTAEIVTLSTCNNADYDTKIFVYSGACGALVCEANNDDFTGCAGFTSELEFVSDGSTTYLISVNGYNNPDGTFTSDGTGNLSITCAPAPVPPANDDCSGVNGAEALAFGVTVTGDNTNATSAVGNPTCDPFGVISDVWYSFDATATMAVDITTTANGSADEAQFAVYDACGGTEIGCSTGGLLHVEPLVDGTTYYIQVWNDGASARLTEGTFDIVVVEAALSTTDFESEIGFSYYPNPVNDNLSLNAQHEIQNIAVYNMLGQEVLRATPNTLNTEVNMSTLQSGAYFVQVTIEGITETVRILKN